jgi:hypothetical protein
MSPATTTIATAIPSDVTPASTVAAVKATVTDATAAPAAAIAYQTIEVADLAATFSDYVGK